MFNLIFAIDKNMLVGKTESQFGMPWYYSEDLKFYKKMTTGKKCVMGRKTYNAIGGALPNRTTYVLSRDNELKLKDAHVITSVEQLDSNEEWWICGGVNVFLQFLDVATNIYITRIDSVHDGDVYFKSLNLDKFKLVSNQPGENPILSFEKWERK